MSRKFFTQADPVQYRWYEPDRLVLGKPMAEQLRFAVCYWHSFVGAGADPFGEGTFQRPWHGGDDMAQAARKVDVAFELFGLLGARYFTFHDRDLAPEGASLRESNENLRRIADVLGQACADTGVRPLWGMANLTGNRRYMAGAATNPDPEVFAYAAAQSKMALELTHKLGGAGYAIWGGREGYETLLNTDMRRELDQLGRFLNLLVEHKHRIGFQGAILIEPKPCEPCKHHYDFDVATVHGFLLRHGLEQEVQINIEQNHALLAGHTFEHEIAMAQALGVFGSIDMNRGDELLGWDTVHFPSDLPRMVLALYQVMLGGGFSRGGINFDAKLRRQSIDPDDLLHAHAEAMDLTARALLVAEKMLVDDQLAGHVRTRYAGWEGAMGRDILAGKLSLEQLAAHVEQTGLEPQPRSGQQERLEAMVNRYL